MKNIIRWFFVNGLFAALVVGSILTHSKGWQNVAFLTLWEFALMSFVIAPVMIVAVFIGGDKVRERARAVNAMPGWVDATYDISMVLFLAYNGWIATSSLWLLQTFAVWTIRRVVAKPK